MLRAWLALGGLVGGCGGAEPVAKHRDYSAAFEPAPESWDDRSYGDPATDELPPDDDVPPIDFPSCDQAREEHPDDIDLTSRGHAPPDVAVSEYAGLLSRGHYLESCRVPRRAAVHVCAAVVNGRAVGITVQMTPHRQSLVNCVTEAIQAISFPSHPRLDVARTTFAAGE